MMSILVKLMLAAALLHLGLSVYSFSHCHSRKCVQMFERRSHDVLRVDWKPISLFPAEARRFR